MTRIGIISDTHNLLRSEVIEKLQGCNYILHGGDISSQKILDQLEQIAPVKMVRGNNDKDWAEHLPLFLDFELAGLRFYMTHKKRDLPKDLSAYNLVVYGHSHQYAETWLPPIGLHRTLLFNPGSCGPCRFHQPITMAVMEIDADGWLIKRIDIPHTPKETVPKVSSGDIRRQIEIVMREMQKRQIVSAIAQKHSMDDSLVEQIARLYVTHPGVTVDGILTKMGL